MPGLPRRGLEGGEGEADRIEHHVWRSGDGQWYVDGQPEDRDGAVIELIKRLTPDDFVLPERYFAYLRFLRRRKKKSGAYSYSYARKTKDSNLREKILRIRF